MPATGDQRLFRHELQKLMSKRTNRGDSSAAGRTRFLKMQGQAPHLALFLIFLLNGSSLRLALRQVLRLGHKLVSRRLRGLGTQVLDLGLTEHNVGVRGGALEHIRLLDDKQNLRTRMPHNSEIVLGESGWSFCSACAKVYQYLRHESHVRSAMTPPAFASQSLWHGDSLHGVSDWWSAENSHVFALLDRHARNVGHGLHAKLLHRLARLLLRAALLSPGGSSLCTNQPHSVGSLPELPPDVLVLISCWHCQGPAQSMIMTVQRPSIG